MTTATELRQRAAQHEQNAIDSFERCDTDGFLSQWASGINAQKCRMEADLLEAGGMWEFPALFDAKDGERVAAKLIDGRYGTCWALCDKSGRFTGMFVNFIGNAPHPDSYADGQSDKYYRSALRGHARQIANLRAKGFVEGVEDAPAIVKAVGKSYTSVTNIYERTDGGYPVGAKAL